MIALGLATLVLAGPLSTSHWVGVRWLPLLVYAPLSGVSQELFFRASLLPAIQNLYPGRTWLALILHAALFGLWHVALVYPAAPISSWMAVVALFLVTSLAGLAWGWQVQHDRTIVWSMLHHDRTIVWSMLHHTLLLMLMSLFGL